MNIKFLLSAGYLIGSFKLLYYGFLYNCITVSSRFSDGWTRRNFLYFRLTQIFLAVQASSACVVSSERVVFSIYLVFVGPGSIFFYLRGMIKVGSILGRESLTVTT